MTNVAKRPEKFTPRARPAAASLGILVAVLWVAIAVVAVRELTVAQGWTAGSSWLQSVSDTLDGRTSDALTLAIGIAAAVLGLLVLLVALKPGRVTHLATTDEHDLWLSRGALAALAHAVVDRQPGVLSVTAEPAGRRKVAVRVVTREDRTSLEQRIRAALADRVDPLTRQRFDLSVEEVAS